MENQQTETSARLPIVFVRGGKVFANSRDVAAYFEKEHRNVLRDIDNLMKQGVLNFEQGSYTLGNTGTQQHRCFEMDRDGFALLAMGFTGSKALQWKLSYIKAFNAMEEEVRGEAALAELMGEQTGLPLTHHQRLFGMPISKVNAANNTTALALKIAGPEAARHTWRQAGLPDIDNHTIGALAGTPVDDPIGCFRHLMRQAAGNGQTIAQMLTLALNDKVAARSLSHFGISTNPQGASGYVAFANANKFLSVAFSETQWVGEWNVALAQLPSARPSGGRLSFGETQAKAVLISRAEVLSLLNPGAALN